MKTLCTKKIRLFMIAAKILENPFKYQESKKHKGATGALPPSYEIIDFPTNNYFK